MDENTVDAEVVDEEQALPDSVMHEDVRNSTVALPTSSDYNDWSEEEKALADAAGLVQRKKNQPPTIAPRAVIAAFLHQCRRTGLDPIARQIYCIERAGKWQTQISIDGFRLIADRSGEYAGQTAIQWTGDGREWFDVWLFTEPPRAARVGVYRRGFVEPLWAVARWDSYAPMVKDWKSGAEKISPMWAKMPDLMLGKVAEMLALRRAFPQDLAGLYGTEEMDQAQTSPSPRATATRQVAAAAVKSQAEQVWEEWKFLIDASDLEQMQNVQQQAQPVIALEYPGGDGQTVGQYIEARIKELTEAAKSKSEPESKPESEPKKPTGSAKSRAQAGLNSDES